MGNIRVYTLPDNLSVAQKALQLVLIAATEAIAARGRFVLALAGGSTPQQLYALLKETNADWQHWHLVYGDERYLPAGHPDRNSTLVEHGWLDHCTFPAANHHPLPAHLPLAEATQRYGQILEQLFPIDVALLGIGEDGHTASLFPQNLIHDLQCKDICLRISNAPKWPAHRISLSYSTLNKTGKIIFIATGDKKQFAINRWQRDPALPINHIQGANETFLITDLQPDPRHLPPLCENSGLDV